MSPPTLSTGPENDRLESPATSPIRPLAEAIIVAESQLRLLKEDERPPINFIIYLGTACFLFCNQLKITQALRQDQSGLEELKDRLKAIYADPTFTKIRESKISQWPGIDQDYQFIIGFFEGADNN